MHSITGRSNHRVLALAVLSVSLAGFARESTADVVFSDGFEANASNNIVPAGWASYKNWTKGPTATSTAVPNSFQTTGVGAGHPFYGHDWPDNGGKFVAASGGGANPSDIDLWLVSPALSLNGSAAQVSFWTFSMSASTAALEVRVSSGSGVVPNNGGAADNGLPTPLYGGVGDFTTTLLSINPTHQTGVYPTFATDGSFTPAWTQYTATIPAGLVSGTGYVAFRSFGSNVFGSANNYKIIALDDVSVSSIATPDFIKGDFGGSDSTDGAFNKPDGGFDGLDIDAFLLALADPSAYLTLNPSLTAANLVTIGDFGGAESPDGAFNRPDGSLDGLDIDAFLLALADPVAYAQQQPGGRGLSVVPEPTSLSLIGLGAIGLGKRRRR